MKLNPSKIWANSFTEKRLLNKEFYSFVFTAIQKYSDIENIYNWLDIGCGDGRILIPLALQFPHIKFYGVDTNETMIMNLNKIVKKGKIKNLSVKLKRGEDFIRNKRSFNTISFFQSIHFFNIQKIFKNVSEILDKNGYMIIATTTHQQFKFIPYSKNPHINQIEKKRTPDWMDIVHELEVQNIKLLCERNFSLYKVMRNSEDLRNYLYAIPYSAFILINPSECLTIIEDMAKKYQHRKNFNFLIDKFKVGIFKSYE